MNSANKLFCLYSDAPVRRNFLRLPTNLGTIRATSAEEALNTFNNFAASAAIQTADRAVQQVE